MLLLTRAQRTLLAEKLADIANVAAGALVFGQFLGDYPFSRSLAAFGIVIWLVLTGFAVVMAKELEDE